MDVGGSVRNARMRFPVAAVDNPRNHPAWNTCYRESARFARTEDGRLQHAVLCILTVDAEKKSKDEAYWGPLERARQSPKWPGCWQEVRRQAPAERDLEKLQGLAAACVRKADPSVR
jgi:hypothetical protein